LGILFIKLYNFLLLGLFGGAYADYGIFALHVAGLSSIAGGNNFLSSFKQDFRIPRLIVNDVLEFGWILIPVIILYSIAIYNTNIRLVITSADVLHSWSLPSWGTLLWSMYPTLSTLLLIGSITAIYINNGL
ncbi:hypothetical protein L9F63_026774, partial [Diploptera punctata]